MVVVNNMYYSEYIGFGLRIETGAEWATIVDTFDTFQTVDVVVDSHIQRIVLATEETRVTHHVSHRHIKCQPHYS